MPLRDHIRYTILGLRLAGLYQESADFFKSKYYWVYCVFINVFFVSILNVCLLGYIIQHLDEPKEATSNAYVAITFLMPNIKVYFFLSKWSFIRKLIDQLDDEDFQPKNKRQEAKCAEFFWYYHTIQLLFGFLGPCLAILWAVGPVLSSERRLPFRTWLPYEWKDPILYELTYLHQAVAGSLTIFINVHMDLMSFGITSYVALEFYMLSDTLNNLKEFAKKSLVEKGISRLEEDDKVLQKEMDETLVSCVHYHKKIVRFAEDTDAFFSVLIFIQFGSSLIALCFTMYELSVTTTLVDIFATTFYQAGLSVELLYYCFFGTTIVTMSEEVAKAIYNTPWVDSSHFFRRTLLFFIARAQKPLQMRALNFFELSLPTFASIYRISWSFFLMLHQTQTRV